MESIVAERPRTILAIDDHELVRVGLRTVITQNFGRRFDMVDAQSLEQALHYLKDHVGNVFLLLLDLHLSDTRGLIGLQLLKQHYPHLPIVVVSGTQNPRVKEEALKSGAIAYFTKTGDDNSVIGFLEIIERIAEGSLLTQVTCSLADLKAAAIQPTKRKLAEKGMELKLNSRQVQMLELILSGYDNQAIAHETGLALGSVKNYVSSIFLAFNVRSRAELIGLFAN